MECALDSCNNNMPTYRGWGQPVKFCSARCRWDMERARKRAWWHANKQRYRYQGMPPRPRIPSSTRKAVVRSFTEGRSERYTARVYGVSRSTVHRIWERI